MSYDRDTPGLPQYFLPLHTPQIFHIGVMLRKSKYSDKDKFESQHKLNIIGN